MSLPRLQLFELEDLPWFPRTIRDLATDYLRFMEARFELHLPALPVLRDALQRSKASTVIDLCSGGGGPVAALYAALSEESAAVHFILTDKYPNLAAFREVAVQHGNGISCVAHPVDAAQVPPELRGFRTMFNAFHHFAPQAARRVLQNAVDAQQPIGVFEVPERRLITTLPLLLTPLFVLAATPFIRPFLWRRLLWTYLLPLVPLTCWWDGIVSQLRAYTVSELRTLAQGLGDGDYEWRAGQVSIGRTPGHLTYLVGIPSTSSA